MVALNDKAWSMAQAAVKRKMSRESALPMPAALAQNENSLTKLTEWTEQGLVQESAAFCCSADCSLNEASLADCSLNEALLAACSA